MPYAVRFLLRENTIPDEASTVEALALAACSRHTGTHGFPCGEHAPQVRVRHVASKYVVARSVAKCLSDLRTVPVA